MRRDFELGPEDVRALDALGLPWEAMRSGPARYVLIHDHPVPAGYSAATVRVAIRADAYPPGPLDMAYVYPPLARTDGQGINNLSTLSPSTARPSSSGRGITPSAAGSILYPAT